MQSSGHVIIEVVLMDFVGAFDHEDGQHSVGQAKSDAAALVRHRPRSAQNPKARDSAAQQESHRPPDSQPASHRVTRTASNNRTGSLPIDYYPFPSHLMRRSCFAGQMLPAVVGESRQIPLESATNHAQAATCDHARDFDADFPAWPGYSQTRRSHACFLASLRSSPAVRARNPPRHSPKFARSRASTPRRRRAAASSPSGGVALLG